MFISSPLIVKLILKHVHNNKRMGRHASLRKMKYNGGRPICVVTYIVCAACLVKSVFMIRDTRSYVFKNSKGARIF